MNAMEVARIRQGANAGTSPDVLRQLVHDPSVHVRASLALNPELPDDVAAVLAVDTDERVRSIVSRKIATLTPTLPSEGRQRVQQEAVANLTTLVAEAAQRVRMSIAEAVRDLPDAPREIVLRLAHDPAVMICEPVILFSPLLTQEDLIALVASGPPASTIMAVARRPQIGEAVSDAIVDMADETAIGVLLANKTAQIREATLDALAAQSEQHTAWQEALVRRPHLSPRAQRMLAEIITGHLTEVLAARSDLDPKIAGLVRAAGTQPTPLPISGVGADKLSSEAALSQAQALDRKGELDDYAILDALRANAPQLALAMLAVKARVAASAVDHACNLRSAKAVISLAWKAGLSAQTAVVLQSVLARLSPNQILRTGPDGSFPLSEAEMRWQLSFLDVGNAEPRRWMPRASA